MRKTKQKYQPSCDYCVFGKHSPIKNEILCEKMGIRAADSKCNKFKYDPLKRQPKKKPALPKFDKQDFEL